MSIVTEKNNKQDVKIGKLETNVENLSDRFDKFVTNDFWHLKRQVDWILWILILGTLAQIAVSVGVNNLA